LFDLNPFKINNIYMFLSAIGVWKCTCKMN
jgi:hypothetical protein